MKAVKETINRAMDHRAHWRIAITMMRDYGALLAGKDSDADRVDWEQVRQEFESTMDALAELPYEVRTELAVLRAQLAGVTNDRDLLAQRTTLLREALDDSRGYVKNFTTAGLFRRLLMALTGSLA